MFPYTEKYTESESDIQNNNLLYKIQPKCQNTFENLGEKIKLENVQKFLNFRMCLVHTYPITL